jgi:lipopolysaccharide transport system ATP-binding protein
MESIIDIHNISKKYRIGAIQPYVSLRDVISNSFQNIFSNKQRPEFWALDDVSMKIYAGERIGIVGKNGAGKSTLLKIISRITPPTKGTIAIRGKVASLLEVGTGFHQELTGRENIYLNGSILGMKKKQIDLRLGEIIDFSGVEEFIDTPLKHYSSGMQLRLAFSVAAHLEPDILLIDEVLAVGDAEFQKKCLGKMEEINQKSGRTILFISHNLNQVKRFCNKGALLHQGKLMSFGAIDEVIERYTVLSGGNNSKWSAVKKDGDHLIKEISLHTDNNIELTQAVSPSDKLQLTVYIASKKQIKNSQLAIRITNAENIPVFTTTNSDAALSFRNIEEGNHRFTVDLPSKLFVPGLYQVTVAWVIPGIAQLDKVEDQVSFEIDDPHYPGHLLKDGRLGILNQTIEWKHDQL